MFLNLFGSTQSVTFQCSYRIDPGTMYYCVALNSVNITSLDESQVDSISGTHKAGYNNDNVEGFQINQKGVVSYSTGMIFLDVEKVFDRVWHNGLLYKMLKLRFPLPLIKTVSSFLSERSFSVFIQTQISCV